MLLTVVIWFVIITVAFWLLTVVGAFLMVVLQPFFNWLDDQSWWQRREHVIVPPGRDR